MGEQRSPGRQLLAFAVLVVAVAATGILWWTFAGAHLAGVNTNVLYLGEVTFQLAVIGVPLVLLQRRRRGRDRRGQDLSHGT